MTPFVEIYKKVMKAIYKLSTEHDSTDIHLRTTDALITYEQMNELMNDCLFLFIHIHTYVVFERTDKLH